MQLERRSKPGQGYCINGAGQRHRLTAHADHQAMAGSVSCHLLKALHCLGVPWVWRRCELGVDCYQAVSEVEDEVDLMAGGSAPEVDRRHLAMVCKSAHKLPQYSGLEE